MTRRECLRLAALACAGGGLTAAAGAVNNRAVLEAIDHLLLGAPDLEAAMAWFTEATGVQPAVGGSHPGMGTRNALVSLGPRQYLEIIAPDPAQSQFNFQIDLRTLAAPRLVTWAASTADIEAIASAARSAGFTVFGPRDGSRTRPDGSTLRWRSAGVQADFRTATVDPVPFFIQWAEGSAHPAADSPGGCRIVRLELRHPDADRLRRALAALGIEAPVATGEAAGLRAVITTPKGEVRLES